MNQIYNYSDNHYRRTSPITASYIKTGNPYLYALKTVLTWVFVSLGLYLGYILLASF